MRTLDDRLAAGFAGGAEWLTAIVELASGQERRNQRRTQARHEYSFSYAWRTVAECREIKAFHMDMRGRKTSWLLRDYSDDTAEQQLAGTGDGSAVAFQAVMNYGSESVYQRTIRHIVPGTLFAYVNGSLATVSSEASGLVTLASPPSIGHQIRYSFKFLVPVRFTIDRVDIEIDGPDGKYGRISNLGAREVLA